jgi:hypothetical protein
MKTRAVLLAAVLLCSVPALPASFVFSPQTQTVDRACTVVLGGADFVNAIGLDIAIVFDADRVRCDSVRFDPSRLPGFCEFYRRIDNEAGFIEVVLLKQILSGSTGSADSLLILSFEPLANGAATVRIVKTYRNGDPLLLDHTLASIEAAVDTAEVIVAVEPPPLTITETKLHQNYPNPFNPATTIRFDVASRSTVYLRIFDVNGKLIRTLIDGVEYGDGRWEKVWDGTNGGGSAVQSGVYLCVLEAGGRRTSAKMVLLR